MIPIYDIQFNEDSGVELISVVDNPAIEELFVKMNKQGEEENIKLSTDSYKRIVLGAALIPDKLIYRVDENGNSFYIKFSKDVIDKTVEKFFTKPDRITMMDTNHNSKMINGATLVTSYQLSESLKDERFSHLPEGSWIVGYKIQDDKTWNMILSGELNGFSIDGMYSIDKQQLSTQKKDDISLSHLINQIYKK